MTVFFLFFFILLLSFHDTSDDMSGRREKGEGRREKGEGVVG